MLKNYSKIKVYKNGDKHYLNDEWQYHNLDGSAVEYSNGSKHWCINGNLHRNIDPFAEYSDGEKFWRFKDKPHRVGGSFSSYNKVWYINGKEYYTKRQYFNKVWNI